VTSSAVSWFDPVTVEHLAELVSIRSCVSAVPRRSAVGLPIFRGTACSLAALGALAGGSEVDDLSHAMFDNLRNLRWASGLAYCNPRQIRRYGDETCGGCLTRTGTQQRIESVWQ
jgi:hypothetical protein